MKNGLPWCARGSARRARRARGPRRRGRAAARAVSAAVERLQRDRLVGSASRPGRRVLGPVVDERRASCVPSIASTRPSSIAWLPSSIQCRSSITRTSVLRRAGLLTRRQRKSAERALARLGAHLRHRPLGVGDAEEVEDQRQVLGEGRVEQQRAAGDLLPRELLGVAGRRSRRRSAASAGSA